MFTRETITPFILTRAVGSPLPVPDGEPLQHSGPHLPRGDVIFSVVVHGAQCSTPLNTVVICTAEPSRVAVH